MTKFHEGEFGHVLVAVKPRDFRRHLCLFRFIPYLLGDDLIFEFIFRKTLGRMTTIPQGCEKQKKDLNEVLKEL